MGAGWPLPLAIIVILVTLRLLGIVLERVAVRPFRRASSIAWLLSTIAVGIIAENIAMVAFGKDARAFPSALMRGADDPRAGVYPHELLVPVAGLAVMIAVKEPRPVIIWPPRRTEHVPPVHGTGPTHHRHRS